MSRVPITGEELKLPDSLRRVLSQKEDDVSTATTGEEGDHVPATDLSPIDVLPQGIQIRTPTKKR